MTASTLQAPTTTDLPAEAPVIEIDGVNHFFGAGETRKQVLFQNQLSIQPGEIVIMTGPSGSGKTTLLTLVGTLRRLQEGSLTVLGQQLNGIGERDILQLRKRIGFIFQAHNLFESLTAFQNVKMSTQLAGIDDRTAKPKIEELLGRLGLDERIHYKPHSLSGGQKQRVAIARGLIHQPRLILADEPTAALDEKSGREVVTMFQELAKQQACTVLMVTHDNRILDVADRIVNMVDGHISSNVVVKESADICRQLREFPLFQEFTPNTLAEIADQMERRKYQSGDAIIRQGESGDEFFLLRKGAVEVVVRENDSVVRTATMSDGAYFGEVALLEDQPRNASVIATAACECYVLKKEEFQRVVGASRTFEEELRKVLFQRQ